MTTESGVVVIYSGIKDVLSDNRRHLHLYMCNHSNRNCIEIFANDPVPGEESERIYVNADMVISKLENGVLLEEFDKRMKELLRLNQIHDRSTLLKDVTSRLVVKFLLERIKIREEYHAESPNSRFCSLFFEPKSQDIVSPQGKIDFQYESKPAKVFPVRLVMPSGKTMPSEHDIIVEDVVEESLMAEADIKNNDTEELDSSLLDTELTTNKARQQHHSNNVSKSDFMIAKDKEDSSWFVGEGNDIVCNPEDSLRSDNTTQSAATYGGSGDNDIKLNTVNGVDSMGSRKILTRKRSMSEGDLFVKAAGLASLMASDGSNVDTSIANRGTIDDATIESCKYGTSNKQLLPHINGEFHYNRDVPIDENLPSYLLPTSSNYAKKLPPIRSSTTNGSRPSTATSSDTSSSSRRTSLSTRISPLSPNDINGIGLKRGTSYRQPNENKNIGNLGASLRRASTSGLSVRVSRSDDNLVKQNSVSRMDNMPTQGNIHHGGAVGRLQDLQNSHKKSTVLD